MMIERDHWDRNEGPREPRAGDAPLVEELQMLRPRLTVR
jgi:hypothetical protein